MGSEELAANLFRITQTEAKLKSIKQIEKEQLKRLKNKKTKLMLDE